MFHGAGHNRSTDIKRMANLLQVSSAFGRAMESVDRERVSAALFPVLVGLKAKGVPDSDLRNVIAAGAEGFGFPTNLDLDQPADDLAPETQAELLWRAVTDGMDPDSFRQQLAAQVRRRESDH